MDADVLGLSEHVMICENQKGRMCDVQGSVASGVQSSWLFGDPVPSPL